MTIRHSVVSILWVGGVLGIILAFLTVQHFHRGHQQSIGPDHLDQLFREASEDPAVFESSAQSESALHKIGEDGSNRATSMLIQLSTRGSQIPGSEIRPAAIEELKTRIDPRIPVVLVGLISTESGLDVRKAAAHALKSFQCNLACTQALFKYLNEIYEGKLNIETRTAISISALDDDTKKFLEKQQEDIYADIYRVLMNQPSTTNEVLADQFGLGSDTPQDFGIGFSIKANDTEACPDLVDSLRKASGSLSQTQTKRRLMEAVQKLRCRD